MPAVGIHERCVGEIGKALVLRADAALKEQKLRGGAFFGIGEAGIIELKSKRGHIRSYPRVKAGGGLARGGIKHTEVLYNDAVGLGGVKVLAGQRGEPRGDLGTVLDRIGYLAHYRFGLYAVPSAEPAVYLVEAYHVVPVKNGGFDEIVKALQVGADTAFERDPLRLGPAATVVEDAYFVGIVIHSYIVNLFGKISTKFDGGFPYVLVTFYGIFVVKS